MGPGLSRREVLQGVVGVAVVVAGGSTRLIGTAAAAQTSRPGATLLLSDFAPLVNTVFDVDVGRRLRLVLVEAVDRPARTQTRRPLVGDAFSLLFVAARTKEADVPGAVYSFFHPALGTFPLFVTPLGPGRRGLRFEAVVNHQTLGA